MSSSKCSHTHQQCIKSRSREIVVKARSKKWKFRWVDLELLPPAEERVVGEGGIPREAVSDL